MIDQPSQLVTTKTKDWVNNQILKKISPSVESNLALLGSKINDRNTGHEIIGIHQNCIFCST